MRMTRPTENDIQVNTEATLAKIEKFCKDHNKKTPDLEFYLISQMIPTFNRGLNWRIIPEAYPEWKQIDRWYDKINRDVEHWKCYKVQSSKGERYAYVVEVEGEYLEDLFDATMPPELWSRPVKENLSAFRDDSKRNLYQYLLENKEGKNKSANLMLCIYNQNISPKVMDVPAYAVTLAECAYLCQRAGYFFVAKGVGSDYEGARFSPAEVVKPNRSAFVAKFMETLRYTPGANAVQIQVSTLTDKEMKTYTKSGAM